MVVEVLRAGERQTSSCESSKNGSARDQSFIKLSPRCVSIGDAVWRNTECSKRKLFYFEKSDFFVVLFDCVSKKCFIY